MTKCRVSDCSRSYGTGLELLCSRGYNGAVTMILNNSQGIQSSHFHFFFFLAILSGCFALRNGPRAKLAVVRESGVELVSEHGSQEVDKMQTAMSGGCTGLEVFVCARNASSFCYLGTLWAWALAGDILEHHSDGYMSTMRETSGPKAM